MPHFFVWITLMIIRIYQHCSVVGGP